MVRIGADLFLHCSIRRKVFRITADSLFLFRFTAFPAVRIILIRRQELFLYALGSHADKSVIILFPKRLIYRIILIRNFRRDLRLGISVILRSLFGTSIHLRRICFMVQGVYRTFSCQNREILLLCIRIDNKTVEGIFRAVAIRVIRICAVLNIVISA